MSIWHNYTFCWTEVNIPVYGKLGKMGNGTCGEVYSRYFDVEIRDTNTDEKLKNGAVGEIMVRPKISFCRRF